MQKRLSRNDGIFLGLVAVLLVAVAVFYMLSLGTAGARVLVTVDGNEYGTYMLHENQEVPIIVDGKQVNLLEIKDGVANMTWADCPDKLCVHQKAISKTKETIVCLPNKVVVQVLGNEESEFDSIAK